MQLQSDFMPCTMRIVFPHKSAALIEAGFLGVSSESLVHVKTIWIHVGMEELQNVNTFNSPFYTEIVQYWCSEDPEICHGYLFTMNHTKCGVMPPSVWLYTACQHHGIRGVTPCYLVSSHCFHLYSLKSKILFWILFNLYNIWYPLSLNYNLNKMYIECKCTYECVYRK